ncbi:MAG: hypothetical protein E6342_17655 [Clostridium sp.]|uniref:hypothetical protein n=1 Tax=Clostridium sp. TaxID=1506 RepID=UPI002910CD22|nr:hypothetical protein [Clostridium sp.]MDU4843979.1 hypothetical protein [Leclercia adecarboxylata]MDU7089515.1 hypothetical protein [Clostridium sp.]
MERLGTSITADEFNSLSENLLDMYNKPTNNINEVYGYDAEIYEFTNCIICKHLKCKKTSPIELSFSCEKNDCCSDNNKTICEKLMICFFIEELEAYRESMFKMINIKR